MTGKLSVVIPVYNGEKFLERCLDSIVKQTYQNLEILIIDDGSTDHSSSIYDKFARDDKRVVIYKQDNKGVSTARNVGMQKMTGDFVTFVDNDDWLDTDIYHQAMKTYESSNADVIDFECVFATTNGNVEPIKKEYQSNIYEQQDVLWHYLYRGLSVQNSAPYSACRKIYTKKSINDFRFIVGIKNEDIEFNYRISKNINKIVVLDRIGYYYFQNTQSRSNNQLVNNDLDLLKVCEFMFAEEKGNQYKDINVLARTKLARSYFSILAKIAKYGFSSEIDGNSLCIELTKELRKNWVLLMKSPITLNRKFMITLFCMNCHSPIVLSSIKMKR